MIYEIGLIILSGLTTFFFTRKYYVKLIKNSHSEEGTGKFGLYESHSYTNNYHVEVEELQSVDGFTKVRLLRSYLYEGRMGLVHKNNIAWVSTSHIKWYNDNTRVQRDKKIDKIIES